MKERIYTYDTAEIKVSWDKNRCIHAEECVHGLPAVFDPKSKPWIKPEQADKAELIRVIERCPSGALHYSHSQEEESIPAQNVITLVKDGPVYIHGEVLIQNSDGDILLKDTRVAMCRCGKSKNKPLCDNSHLEADFKADTSFDPDRLTTEPVSGKGGPLSIRLIPNAPFVVEGDYEVKGEETGSQASSKKMSFCRCGGSGHKPFCDGTHKKIGFTSD